MSTMAARRRTLLRRIGEASPLAATIVRFGTATVASASLSFLLPLALHAWAGLGERLSVAIAFVVAYGANFLMLRRMVFASKTGWARDLAFYAVVNAAFRVAEFLLFAALRAWAILPYAAALLAVLALSTIVKFFAYRRLFGHVG